MKTKYKIKADDDVTDTVHLDLPRTGIEQVLAAVRAALETGASKVVISEKERFYRDIRREHGIHDSSNGKVTHD